MGQPRGIRGYGGVKAAGSIQEPLITELKFTPYSRPRYPILPASLPVRGKALYPVSLPKEENAEERSNAAANKA